MRLRTCHSRNGSSMRSAARCISSRQLGTLIRITTGGIRRGALAYLKLRVCSRIPSGPRVASQTTRLRKASRILLEPALQATTVGSPPLGRGPRPTRRGDRQALRLTVRSTLHSASLAPYIYIGEVAAGTLNCVCYVPCIALPSDPQFATVTFGGSAREARGLAQLHAAPELFLGCEQDMLIERIPTSSPRASFLSSSVVDRLLDWEIRANQ